MNIFFDAHVADPNFFDSIPRAAEIALQKMYLYVYDRVKIIDEELIAEETEDEGRAIMIYLLTKPRAIQPFKYSQALSEKIASCFNEYDRDVMWLSINKELEGLI